MTKIHSRIVFHFYMGLLHIVVIQALYCELLVLRLKNCIQVSDLYCMYAQCV